MKIKLANKIDSQGLELFDDTYVYGEDIENEDAILLRSASLHEYSFPSSVKAIARAGAGVNNIPIERCSELGIAVFNTPGANANAVKELTLCSLFLASRDIRSGILWEEDLKDSEDFSKVIEKGKSAFVGPEVTGKKLGVLGLGAIGVLVANAAVKLGMEVYGYDPYLSVDAAWRLMRDIRHAVSLDEIYQNSDFITIHVPFMESTRGMVSREGISKMKDGVRFLNFARDALVDEEAMAEALETGKVRSYVTDFANPRSVKMKNTVVLPHLGASTEEAEENCAVMAVRELQDYLDNGNITHSVNYPDLNAGICQSACRVAILHHNIPNMISQITSFFGRNGLNIENLASKTKGKYEYTLIDLDEPMPHDTVEKLKEIEGVLRVRRLGGTSADIY